MAEEVVKKKRGRPRKNPIPTLPEEVQQIINEVKEKENQEFHQVIEEAKQERRGEWDVKIGDQIEYFDSSLSYELTGYKPITETKSLDFDPSWFTEARDTFNRTGHYCEYRKGSKAFRDFWTEQYKRCKYGLTVNGYTVTGDHYFFLNFYRLKDLVNVEEGGSGRNEIFPNFLEGQYQWFHYLSMARKLRLNACMMKAREMGYSEIEASIASKSYTVIRGSVNVCSAFAETQLKKLWEKIESNLSFLDRNTGGGFSHSRLVDSATLKRAGQYIMQNGTKVPSGWGSQIQAITVDKPGKLRGDRTDILIFEEAGIWPNFTKAYTMADALVGQIGSQWGLRLIGGTGGESDAAMAGLRKMYYNPKLFGVLPYRHKYTQTGEYAVTSFFLPAFKGIKDTSMLDNRGYISDEKGRAYFQKIRDIKASDPQELVTYCAEYCFNGEEAFSLEGNNKFNKINITDQLTRIRALKQSPPIEVGYLDYQYKNDRHTEENIVGFKWKPDLTQKLKILERPIWELPPRELEDGQMWNPPTEKINNLYVIGIDGIDIGKAQTSENTKDPSDFCLTVFKRAYGIEEPQFVALYKDRPNDIREAYRIAIRLAQYYNAKINIEATRQSIIPYAREKKLLHLFMKRPKATLAESMINTNKQYGTPGTPAIIEHQTDLMADYVNDYCHLIWFDEMLDELNRYNPENKRKFDIVAAACMALLADEELQGVVPKKIENQYDEFEDFGYYVDERGYKKWGIIPKKTTPRYGWDTQPISDYSYNRTSDPRRR